MPSFSVAFFHSLLGAILLMDSMPRSFMSSVKTSESDAADVLTSNTEGSYLVFGLFSTSVLMSNGSDIFPSSSVTDEISSVFPLSKRPEQPERRKREHNNETIFLFISFVLLDTFMYPHEIPLIRSILVHKKTDAKQTKGQPKIKGYKEAYL